MCEMFLVLFNPTWVLLFTLPENLKDTTLDAFGRGSFLILPCENDNIWGVHTHTPM